MSHQYELYEQVKAMLASKYFNDSPDAKKLESGDIFVSSDIQIATNDNNRLLKVTLQFQCKDIGIVSRTILKINAPSHAYKRIVDLITQINSNKTFSCFEFDYRDGEIAARNFLQCIDYVPSIATLYTMIGDTTSKFMEYGDRLIEMIGVDANTLEIHDAAKAKDVFMEALNGDVESQQLLLDLINRDPDSSNYHKLKDAADSGNMTAQSLLSQLVATAAASNVDVSKVVMPDVISREELVKTTLDRAGRVLMTARNDEIAERDFYIEQMNNAYDAASGNIRECSNIASSLFLNEKLPQLYDPYLAYQWYARAKALTDGENYVAFRGVPGGNYQGVVDLFYEYMAEMVLMFGSREQKRKALHIMKSYIDKYWGAAYLCTDNFIYALLGIPPREACRKLGYALSDVPVNRELAVLYYKKMIDGDIADNNHNHAKYMAEQFEVLLGIKYYDSNQNSHLTTSTSSSASTVPKIGCYIATCVYGSYDCPQVWTLRRYRDNVLAESALGRAFIRFYYAVSPRLVKVFGGCSPVRSVWKVFLDKMVIDLNEKGYQDTPYEDRSWIH